MACNYFVLFLFYWFRLMFWSFFSTIMQTVFSSRKNTLFVLFTKLFQLNRQNMYFSRTDQSNKLNYLALQTHAWSFKCRTRCVIKYSFHRQIIAMNLTIYWKNKLLRIVNIRTLFLRKKHVFEFESHSVYLTW